MAQITGKVIALGCVGLICLAGLLGWHLHQQSWRDHHPLQDPKMGFQFLQPQTLPAGLRVTDERIDVTHAGAHQFKSVAVELNLRSQDWVYDIQEMKAAQQSIVVPLQNYNATSVDTTCANEKSPQGQQYRLCHWTDYGTISVYEVSFVTRCVDIRARLPLSTARELSLSELGAFVDSFVPGNASKFPVLADAV